MFEDLCVHWSLYKCRVMSDKGSAEAIGLHAGTVHCFLLQDTGFSIAHLSQVIHYRWKIVQHKGGLCQWQTPPTSFKDVAHMNSQMHFKQVTSPY